MTIKINSTARLYAGKKRLSEVASLINVAIARLHLREKEKLLQKSLDFGSEWSVTAASTE